MTDLKSKLDDVVAACKAHDVARLELFGSRSRADFREDSDYDFLVEFRQPRAPGAFNNYFSLRETLEAILSAKIDLLEPGAIRNPYLQRAIDADRQVVYAA